MLVSSKSADGLTRRAALRTSTNTRMDVPRHLVLSDVFARSTVSLGVCESESLPSMAVMLRSLAPTRVPASRTFVRLHCAIVDHNSVEFDAIIARHKLADGTVPALLERDPLSGKTLTHFAAERQRSDMLDKLLQHGAPRDLPDRRYGRTPLHAALHVEDVESMEVLLRHGANTEIPAFNGYTPLQSAVEDGNSEIESLLRAYGANGSCDTVVCSPRLIGLQGVLRVPSADAIAQHRQAAWLDAERGALRRIAVQQSQEKQ